MHLMASILIKDTTREQREQIVRESLGDDYDVGCGYESTGINYQLYIDGIKELRELNMELHILPDDMWKSKCFLFRFQKVLKL